jgi:hypothetical protein
VENKQKERRNEGWKEENSKEEDTRTEKKDEE